MICPKCGSEIPEGSSFCTKCGAAMGVNVQQGMPQGNPNPQMGNPQPFGAANGQPYGNSQMGMPQPYMDPKDHTGEFDPRDISTNKVLAMMPYLMGTIGIIIALLASKESPYVAFHVRQSLKITVCSVLVGIITALLFWTIIVPVAGGVCTIILLVVRIICFFQICSGKAKEPAIVSSLGFLK